MTNTTIIFIAVVVFAIAVFDVYIIASKGKFESISAHIIRLSKKAPLLVLALGIVLGHLFWSMSSFDHLEEKEIIQQCLNYTDKLKLIN